MVSSPWVDGASATAQTMEWLATLGMHRTVVVLNDRRARRQTDPHHFGAAIRQPRPGRHRGVLGSTPASGRVIDVSHEMSCDLVLSASASVILAPGFVRPRIDTKSSLCLCHSAPWPTKWGTSQLACPPTTSLGYREQIAEGKARQEAGKRYGW